MTNPDETNPDEFVPVYMPRQTPDEMPGYWPQTQAGEVAWLRFRIDQFKAREDAFRRWVAYERQQVKWLREARDLRDAEESAKLDRELEEKLREIGLKYDEEMRQIALRYEPAPTLIVIDPLMNHLADEDTRVEPS